MEATNLSKIKRDEMIGFLEHLKENNNDDESIKAINEIMNQINSTKYGLVWEQHQERVDIELENNIPIFSEIKEKKICSDKSLKYNYLLEGDNLHSLYLLEKTHRGKIDFIYIDPPYNTGGKDFIYNDRIVDKEDLYKHSKWLSFMNKRITIAQKLLSEEGCMFISIDEHEMAQLMLLCQEIFGEDNVEVLVWRKNGKQGNTKIIHRIKNTHEYIIIAYKNKNITKFKKMKMYPTWQNTSNPDNDPRGNWVSGNISKEENKSRKDSPNYYSVTTPSGKIVTREWFIPKEEYERLANDILINSEGKEVSRIYFASDGSGIPRIKRFKNEEQEFYFDSIIDSLGTFSDAKDELIDIFGDRDIFDTPKPSKMIKELIRIASKKNSIILDFFAGSATTAQAVLELNEEDEGNRTFILCTNNEIDEDFTIKYLEDNNYINKIERNKNGKIKNNCVEYEQYREFLESNKFKEIIKQDDYQELGISRRIAYVRIKNIIEGKENLKYPKGIKANLKYFFTDWTPKKTEDYLLSNILLLHIKEMIELQNAIEVDNESNVIIFNKDDYKKYILNEDKYMKIQNMWVNQNIVFTSEELKKLCDKGFKYIPKEFFGQ